MKQVQGFDEARTASPYLTEQEVEIQRAIWESPKTSISHLTFLIIFIPLACIFFALV